MNKPLLRVLLIIVGIAIVTFFGLAFIYANFNIVVWGKDVKAIAVCGWLIISCLFLNVWLESEDQN